jgi:hypothetical protein
VRQKAGDSITAPVKPAKYVLLQHVPDLTILTPLEGRCSDFFEDSWQVLAGQCGGGPSMARMPSMSLQGRIHGVPTTALSRLHEFTSV